VREGANLAAREKSGKLPAQLAREAGGEGAGQFVAMVYYGALSHRSTSDRLEDVRAALKSDPAALKDTGPDGPLLHVAVALRQTALVKVVLECGADPDQRDASGRTALHRACWGHDPPTVAALLASKAQVDARDKEGRTPLHAAADSPATGRTADLLLDRGADPIAKDARGATPMEYAATSAYDERQAFIEALLKRGVPLDVFAAAALGKQEVLREILEKDPGLVAGGPGEHRATPLHVAAWHGQRDAARMLLDRGADVNAGADGKEPLARTPLFDALLKRRLDVAELLLDRGARTDVRNGSGVTPLHVATMSGIGEPGVRLLLKHKADPNVPDLAGQTPLHLGAGYCASGTVRALLDAGADPSSKDKSGLAPIDYAKRFNLSRPDIVDLLKHRTGAKNEQNGKT
jgi:cytohesin